MTIRDDLFENFPELATAKVTFDPRRNTAPHTYRGVHATDQPAQHPAHDGQTCAEYRQTLLASDAYEAIRRLRQIFAFSSRDWSEADDTARLYALIVGWESEDPEEPSDAYPSLAAKFNWPPQLVAELKKLRAAFAGLPELLTLVVDQQRLLIEHERASRRPVRCGVVVDHAPHGHRGGWPGNPLFRCPGWPASYKPQDV